VAVEAITGEIVVVVVHVDVKAIFVAAWSSGRV
jgi:hypothetical protein